MESARKMSESTSRDEGTGWISNCTSGGPVGHLLVARWDEGLQLVTGMAGVEREMENLFNALRPDSGMDKDHQQRIKDKVFGPTSFYVTEIRPLASLKLVNLNSPSASNQDLVAFSVLVSTQPSTSRPACGLDFTLLVPSSELY